MKHENDASDFEPPVGDPADGPVETVLGGVIRDYGEGDRAGFERLVRSVHEEFGYRFDPELDADLGDPAKFYVKIWVLATEDGSVTGSVALKPLDKDGLELKRMYLAPALRGQGLGQRLLGEAISWSRESGCRYIVLDTAGHQTEAQRLYQGAGFVEIDRLHSADAPDTIRYRLDLFSTPDRPLA